MGTGEWSNMPTVVFRLAGQDSIEPSDSDQSWLAISFAVVPPPARNDACGFPQSRRNIPHHKHNDFPVPDKLRGDGEVPHAVRIEKEDALDGPAKIKCEVLCVVNGRRTGMP